MNRLQIKWIIAVMLFLATGLNFLDRQVLSIAIIKIQKELGITDTQYGFINTAFLISYGLMFAVSGRLIDKFGGKAGLAVAVAIWSVANCLHGLANSFAHLLAFRFVLGLGEGGCFPGAAKVVTEWFDNKDRALANGIAIGGSAIGAVIAPPLTTYITNAFGWRDSFVIPGVIGIAWVIIWLMLPKPKKQYRVEAKKTISFSELLKLKEVWVFVALRFLLDPIFYFLMFWVPKYLNEARGVSFEEVGKLFWIPFLALGISNIMGGWVSDLLVKNNISINRARKIVMGIAAILTFVAPLIATVSTVTMVIVLLSVITFAHGFWITNYITSISDVFGIEATSSVVGLSGTAGALPALLINPLIGKIVQQYSYSPLWIVSGIMYPIAFLIFLLFIPKIKTVLS